MSCIDIIIAKDKELSQKTKTINNWGHDKNRDVTAAKQLRAENVHIKDDLQKAEKTIQNLQSQVTKIQRNLDNSNCQFSKVKREKSVALKQVSKTENAVAAKERVIDNLKYDKMNLERQVKTHETFIKNEFGGDEHLNRANLQNTIEEMRRTIEEKESIIKKANSEVMELKTEMEKSEGDKLKTVREELKQLRSSIEVLEDYGRELEGERDELREMISKTKKELQLEEDINSIMKEDISGKEADNKLKKNQKDGDKKADKISMSDNSQVDGSIYDQANKKVQCPEVFLSKKQECKVKGCNRLHTADRNKIRRGICVYEFKEENSCTYKNCFFSHEFPSELRENEVMRKKVNETLQQMNNRTRVDQNHDHTLTMNESTQSEDAHKRRVKVDRLCVHEYFETGSCVFKEECHFIHKFPESVKMEVTTKKLMKEKWKKIKEKKNKNQEERKTSMLHRKDTPPYNEDKGDIDWDSFLYMIRTLIQNQQPGTNNQYKQNLSQKR